MTGGSIYKIHFPNGKHYIGLTTNSLKRRTIEHKCCAKNGNTKILYKALRKYDMVDTFELIEIDTAKTVEELREKEIQYIKYFNSYYIDGHGYNMTYGGDGVSGYIYTEEEKQKNSERLKRYYEEHPEASEKMSEIINQFYEEHPEAREKMSEIKKTFYEKHPEAREQQSERIKRFYEKHPEAGKEHGEKMKTIYEERPELKKQMSEIKKKQNEERPELRKQMSEIKKKTE